MTKNTAHKVSVLCIKRQMLAVFFLSILMSGANTVFAGEYPLQEARTLYLDLMTFAGEPRFHRFGLSENGPYADWKDNFIELFASPAAIREFKAFTQFEPRILLDLAIKLAEQSGRPDEETQRTIDILNRTLLVKPSDYSPAPDIRLLEGKRLDAEIEGTYGPVTPILEAQDYWLLYLNGANITLVVKEGVIERTLKGRHGARHFHVEDR